MRTRIATALAIAGALTMTAAQAQASTEVSGAGQLRDLQSTTKQPTDHATAQVLVTVSGGSTTVVLKVQGLDHAAAGMGLGAHVHVGSCVAGDGGAAGPHYNSDGGTATELNEVWLDFVVGANGTASAEATVPFVIAAGTAKAVVIHAAETSTGPTPPAGFAGPRWACLPVQF